MFLGLLSRLARGQGIVRTVPSGIGEWGLRAPSSVPLETRPSPFRAPPMSLRLSSSVLERRDASHQEPWDPRRQDAGFRMGAGAAGRAPLLPAPGHPVSEEKKHPLSFHVHAPLQSGALVANPGEKAAQTNAHLTSGASSSHDVLSGPPSGQTIAGQVRAMGSVLCGS